MNDEGLWSEEGEGWDTDTEDFEDQSGCDYGVTEFCSDPQTKENGLCTTECQEYFCSVEAAADGGTQNWKCQICGCTDKNPCEGGCSWVRKNLCSSCAKKQKQQIQENMDKSIAKHVGFCQGADL